MRYNGAGALDYDNALDTLTEAGLRMANELDREPWSEQQVRAKVRFTSKLAATRLTAR